MAAPSQRSAMPASESTPLIEPGDAEALDLPSPAASASVSFDDERVFPSRAGSPHVSGHADDAPATSLPRELQGSLQKCAPNSRCLPGLIFFSALYCTCFVFFGMAVLTKLERRWNAYERLYFCVM